MRFLATLILTGSLIVGCGEDGSENPRSRCLSDGAGGAGGGNPSSPVVVGVAWQALGYCLQGQRNNFNIFVFADDSDSKDLELTFDANVPDCIEIANEFNIFVFSCPNIGPATGVACAEDPDGNVSGRVAFTFQPCETGNCKETPDACSGFALAPSTP